VKRSAGILMFHLSGRKPMVLLVHPGGPYWRNKDRNSWSIPKGEFGDDETAEAAAIRAFEEICVHMPCIPQQGIYPIVDQGKG
jgi:predicted NUDIX family NTP pyrophosphohydrolase